MQHGAWVALAWPDTTKSRKNWQLKYRHTPSNLYRPYIAMQLNTRRCHDNLCVWRRVCILVAIICANQSESKFLSLPLKSCLNVSQENQSFIFNNGKMKLLGQLSFCPLFKLNDWFAWETNLTGFQWTWIPSFRLVGTNNYYQNEMTTKIKSPGGTVKQHVLLINK